MRSTNRVTAGVRRMRRAALRNLVFILGLALGLATAGATGSAGSVDTNYGSGGVADGGAFFVEDAAALSDGSVLVVGIDQSSATSVYAVQKRDPDGALDTDFGTDGFVSVFGSPPARYNWAGAVAVGPDGRIFVGGTRTYSTQVTSGKGKKQTTSSQEVTTGSLLALHADGTVDTDFGADGYLDTGYGVPWRIAFRGTSSAYDIVLAYSVQVETEISGGGKGKGGKTTTLSTSALALHVVDGFSGDDVASFGDGGMMVDDFSATTLENPRAVHIDALGRIVVLTYSAEAQTSDSDMIVSRYTSNGVLDTSLGVDGRLTVGYSNGNSHYTHHFMALDGDGKRIVIAYRRPTVDNRFDTVVVRYAETGSVIDTTFDIPEIPDAVDPSILDTWPVDLDVDANGKVCVTLWSGLEDFESTIVRCNADGTRDTGFGPNADGLSEEIDLSDKEQPTTTVITPSGQLILVGQDSAPIQDVQPYWTAVLVRYDG